ncbi:MAG: helix-turn-helix transcriptional regulator [Paucibacter sp.]|nr:helix-turn-helix transcriptional regulator [Roseateles sp.]
MQELIILSREEGESLVRAIENGLYVRLLRQLFTWSQGAFGALLPHGLMVCAHLDEDDRVLRMECLNAVPRDAESLRRLCDAEQGLVVRIVRHCRQFGLLGYRAHVEPIDGQSHPAETGVACDYEADPTPQSYAASLADLQHSLGRERLRNALVGGTERLYGGATFFAFFEMPSAPTERHEFFLHLLVPHLHQAFLRIIANSEMLGQGTGVVHRPISPQSPLTARELEVMSYLLVGKTNVEIGMILGLSSLTIKNHLQKIYRKLSVSNRVQAMARAHELKILPQGSQMRSSRVGATARRGA